MKRAYVTAIVALSLFLVRPAPGQEGCAVSEQTIDGVRHLVIENRYVRLVIEPENGGKVTRFTAKSSGVELVRPRLGMLWDRFWQAPRREDPWRGPYEADFLQRTAQTVALRLSRNATGEWNFHSIEKTITLRADSPLVSVDYAYKVNENRMTPSIISPWVVNGMSVEGEMNRLFLPLTDGILTVDYSPTAPPMHQDFHYNVSRGWMAAAGQKSAAGIAATMDASRVMTFYLWFGNNQNTMEWMYNTFTVPHGEALQLSHEFIPFRGLTEVAGAGGGVVAQLDAPPTAAPGAEVGIGVKLYNAVAGPLLVALRFEKLPGRLAAVTEEKTLDIPVDETRGFEVAWRPDAEGTYVVRCEVFRAGRKVCNFEKPVRVGRADEAYALLPLEKKLGNPDERYGERGESLKAEDIPALEFREDVVTPHVKWARPYYRGPLRVLVLTDQMQGREIIELKQRMEVEFITPLAIVNKRPFTGDWYGKYTEEMCRIDLTERLKKKDFDVILIGGGCLIWTAEHQKMIADLVRQGVGLVWISAPTPSELKDILPVEASRDVRLRMTWQYPETNHYVTRLLPLPHLPPTSVATGAPTPDAQVLVSLGRNLPLIAAAERKGQGRVLQMNYVTSWGGVGGAFSGLTPYDHGPAREPYPYWEYWYSLVARAVLWAGRFDAPVQPVVRGVQIKAEPGRLADAEIVVALEGPTDGLPGLEVEVVLRDAYAEERFQGKQEWKGQPLSFQCGPVVGAGRHFADIRVAAQGKAVAWGTYGFVAEGGSAIAQVALDRGAEDDVFLEGDDVAASVRTVNVPPGVEVVAELFDGYGRLLSTQSVSAATDVRVAVPVRRSLHAGGTFTVTLRRGGDVLAVNKQFVTLLPESVASQRWDDFMGIAWGTLGAYQHHWLARHKADIMRDMGFNTHNMSAHWHPADTVWAARQGFRLIAMGIAQTGHVSANDDAVRAEFRKTGDKMSLVRRPSLSDPEYIQKTQTETLDRLRKVAPLRPLAYNFGDEVAYAPNGLDYDFSPHALAEMREWLRGEYGTLQALNAEWEADFKDWTEVVPFTAPEAVASGHYARWADLRLFACWSVAKFHRDLIAAMRREDPNAFYGLSGTQVPYPYNGMDWAQLGPVFSYHSNYWGGGELPDLHADITPECRLAQWTGYGGEGPAFRAGIWSRFLRGQAGVSFYEQFSMLNPDLRPSRSGLDCAAATLDMRRGLTKVLLQCAYAKDRVAIYYSMPSILGTTITGFGEPREHRYGWLWAVKDCGINPKYVTCLDVRANGISRKDFDVLILPMTMAMSPEEAVAVRRFVQEGGTVLADALPALLSGHCRKRPAGALDDVFGVRHDDAARPDAPTGELRLSGEAHGLTLGEWAEGTQLFTRRVAPAGGRALGTLDGAPAFIVHRFGQGKACYLNLGMPRYLQARASGKEGVLRERMRVILDWAGAIPIVRIVSPEGKPVDKLEIFRHVRGETQIIGCVLNQPSPVPARLTLPKDGHLYDARQGHYLGAGRTFDITLPAQDALVLAVLPYKAGAVTIAAQGAAPGKPAAVAMRIATDGKPGLHAFRLEVASPNGKPMPHLSQNVLAESGQGQTLIPFALNDPPGDYRISAREVLTGVTAQSVVQVK